MHPSTVTRKTPATLARSSGLTPPPSSAASQAPPPRFVFHHFFFSLGGFYWYKKVIFLGEIKVSIFIKKNVQYLCSTPPSFRWRIAESISFL